MAIADDHPVAQPQIDLDDRAADAADFAGGGIGIGQPIGQWRIAGDLQDLFGIEIAQFHKSHNSVS